MDVALPPSRRLANIEQFELLSKVAEPGPAQRIDRAQLAFELDKFACVRRDIEALPADRRPAHALWLHARACRKLHDIDAAHASAAQALALDPPGELRQMIMLEETMLLRKLDRVDEARTQLFQILDENPYYHTALHQLTTSYFAEGAFADALAALSRLEDKGLRTTRLTTSKTIALAGLGRTEEAAAIAGFPELIGQTQLPELHELNQQVIAELHRHPALRLGNSVQASEGSWRVDELMVRQQPAITKLLKRLAQEVSLYADRLDDCDHPWAAARPAKSRMGAWAILAPRDGNEHWHTHDGGWLSGVYYLAIPQGLDARESKAGTIEFGWPDQLLGDAICAAMPSEVILPCEGDLVLFPSHVHHRTWPHDTDQDRICIAFDIVPV